MAEAIEITDELRARIGVESEPWSFEVTTTGIRAFARGVGYSDPVYYDAAAARAAGYPSLPAPPTYLGTAVFVPGRSHAFLPGFPPDLFRFDVGLPNVLDGGTRLIYERKRPLVAGETLSARVRVTELAVKHSPSLGAMLLMSSETVFSDEAGAVVARETAQVIMY